MSTTLVEPTPVEGLSPTAAVAALAESGVLATGEPETYLPRPALRLYRGLGASEWPLSDYGLKCATRIDDGLKRRAWLCALEDMGLVFCTTDNPVKWGRFDRPGHRTSPEQSPHRRRITGQPEDYLPADALAIYRFVRDNGPSTLEQVRKARPLPGFGVLSWLFGLADLGLLRRDTSTPTIYWLVAE